jgi:hypothetical protein
MFGFGLRYKLERAEAALRAALAERDDYRPRWRNFTGEEDFWAIAVGPAPASEKRRLELERYP